MIFVKSFTLADFGLIIFYPKARNSFQKIWIAEDAMMRRCGEGFRKSGEPKMQRCEDAERVSENLES